MTDKFMGKYLITLPKSHEDFLYVDLSPSESVIYQAVEIRIREHMEALARQAEIDAEHDNLESSSPVPAALSVRRSKSPSGERIMSLMMILRL